MNNSYKSNEKLASNLEIKRKCEGQGNTPKFG